MVSQMLIEIEGLEALEEMIVIRVTNQFETIDKALLRPDRSDKMLYVPPIYKEARLHILKHFAKQIILEEGWPNVLPIISIFSLQMEMKALYGRINQV